MFFQVLPVDGYESVFMDSEDDFRMLRELDGTPKSASWVPPRVYRGKGDKREPGWAADIPWFTFGLVLRSNAIQVLEDLLVRSGELLPLQDAEGVELWIFNSRVVPALDEKASEIWRFKDGRIMNIMSAVIIPSATEGLDLFRVELGGSLFVSERFADRVRKARLSGIRLVGLRTSPLT